MTSYEKIYDRAADNYGYITTRESSELGVPKSEMSALVKRNRLVHKGYGVYRLAWVRLSASALRMVSVRPNVTESFASARRRSC